MTVPTNEQIVTTVLRTYQRVVVVLRSIVTLVTAASVTLAVISEQFPATEGPLTKVIIALGGVITVISRVTPVAPEERGVLPPSHDDADV